MLISLFERAYLTAYSEHMTPLQRRRWNSWEDFMREWVRRDDFYHRLPKLLKGEDPEFAAYLQRIAEEERGKPLPRGFFAFGEVGLAGEVRPAPRGQERLKEAAKLGFSIAVVPKANAPKKAK